MTTEHGLTYKGYLLHCDPMLLTDGRFGAQLRVGKGIGETVFEMRYPTLDCFATAPEATQHARKVAERWVDENG